MLWKFSKSDRRKGPCLIRTTSLLCLASLEQYKQLFYNQNQSRNLNVSLISALKIILSRQIFIIVSGYNPTFFFDVLLTVHLGIFIVLLTVHLSIFIVLLTVHLSIFIVLLTCILVYL